jgi:hypothetical protein
VLLTGLACRRVGRDDALGAARLNSTAIRLLLEPAARACRQLERFHGVGNWCLACRHGEARASGSTTFVWAPYPMLRPLCVGPALVEDGNYSCERVAGGGDSSCEKLVGVRRRLLVRGGDSSREAVTHRARRRLLVRGEDLSGKPPTRRRRVVLPVTVLTRICSLPYPESWT